MCASGKWFCSSNIIEWRVYVRIYVMVYGTSMKTKEKCYYRYKM